MSLKTQSKSSVIETDTIEAWVKWLASYGQSDTGGVNRPLYSSAWIQAQKALKERMDYLGFTTHYDSIGNLFGRVQGSDQDGTTVLTGSHIDTVLDGGMYDGVYGIIASLIATHNLYHKYGTPRKSIEVVSLCEEEGSRFPITFWGSGNITGKYSLTDGVNKRDIDGTELLDAMKIAGFDPENYTSPKRKDLDCFIELHVEQGIVLERTGKSLGIVSHIVGQRRFTVKVSGESNHAGTTPMPYRKDAMHISSQLITELTEKTKKYDPDLVATVGQLTARPNVPNVIAGEVVFTLDVRHHQEETLRTFCKDLAHLFQKKAKDHSVHITMEPWLSIKPVEMDAALTYTSEQAAAESNIAYKTLYSGAGHDAQLFGNFCPTALLFVPSKDGISHSPKEFTTKEDLQAGVDVLTALLYKLAY
ncbi:allantoate deiminase [Aquibacillus koreensis]|uniref:Allantoate deiminase n=1 Tax=Aquibacillus koreensis TaxID=279446 RepID=A0A9X3WK15_9BACI|nr:allantoate deiminase [Aquibacillus koreensis]MCT2537780.1 allantoate deiminase [Aquibacillus koreensis]MDC3421187.1 allantoate deiminase [Aquibacillus koreensis]